MNETVLSQKEADIVLSLFNSRISLGIHMGKDEFALYLKVGGDESYKEYFNL
jgi:hypothetical protein